MISRVHKAVLAFLSLVVASALAGFCLSLLAGERGPPTMVGAVSLVGSPSQAFTVVKPLELSRSPSVTLESGALALANPGGGASSDAALAGGKAALLLDNAVLVVQLAQDAASPDGKPTAGDMAPIAAAFLDQGFASVRLRSGAIVLANGDGTATRLVDVEAEVGVRDGELDARGVFTFRGEKFALSATLGALDAGSGQRSLRLKVDGAPISATLTGRLETAGGLKLVADASEIRAPSVEGAARWLGATWATGNFWELRARGALTWSERAVALDAATVMVDGNEGRGNLTLASSGGRPSIEGTVAFDRLDITPYLAGVGARPVATPFLASLNADLRVSAERVVAGGIELGGGAASLSLDGGRLMADIAEAAAFGGGGDGQLTLDVSGAEPKYTLRGKLDGVDGAALTRSLFGAAIFDGAVDATFDLKGRGHSGEALLSSLAGKIAVELTGEDGKIGVDAERLATLPVGTVENGWGETTARGTAIDWLLGRFTLDQGVATAQSVAAGAGARRISATGAIDLSARELDLRLAIGPRLETDASQPSRRDIAIEIEGPWSTPTLRAIEQPKAARPAEPPYPDREARSPDRG